MPSQAYDVHLTELLKDAEELDNAHGQLRTGNPGRQWGIGALNRAVVVMCVSAWESYVEEVLRETLGLMKPPNPPLGIWPSLNASARSEIGRFNTPNAAKVRELINNSIGLHDITASWNWQNCPPKKAIEHLNTALDFRHKIAHGVNPRPTIHNMYSKRLPGFFRRLGSKTDEGIRDYLVATLGLHCSW